MAGPAEQRRFFEQLARRYDRRLFRSRWPRNQEFKADEIARALGDSLEPGTTVAEIGCGTGQVAELLLERIRDVLYVGLDLSPGMLGVARERLARFGDRVRLEESEAEALPLETGTVRGAFGVDVLHHVASPVQSLREVSRVLEPGGTAFFLEGNPKFPLTALIGLRREERGLFRDNERNFRRWCGEAGFVDVDVRYAGLYTPPGPPALVPLYDAIDRLLPRLPGARALAIFYVVTARKPETRASVV